MNETLHKMFEFNCIVENGAVRVCSQIASLKWSFIKYEKKIP